MVEHCFAVISVKFNAIDSAMKHLFTCLQLFISLCASSQQLAPSIISTAGGSFTNDQIQLSWTLGGSVLDSYETGDINLSSGVQSEEATPFVLGMNESDMAIQIYPNPVKDQLTLQFEEMGNFQVVISDLTGRQVYLGDIAYTNAQLLDISYLSIGAYILQVFDQDLRPIKKFKLSKNR
ncbi:T9SS type A sorting domain-containing protein [Reichenbachiella sp.]|uniref:T9SS type A sorting domain-containing protein n=1 Tax=Reichenbachiella sp. TaxID=2184521 RepID=UPI003264C8CF